MFSQESKNFPYLKHHLKVVRVKLHLRWFSRKKIRFWCH